jgi:hypothetical protein
MQGCHADNPVRLLASPDFSKLFHHGYEPKIAGFMIQNSADLITVCAKTGIDLPKVFDFYNACMIIGLIEQDNIFNPAGYLPGLLEQANADRLARRCALPGGMPLIIAPKEGKYYTEMDAVGLGQLCSARLSELDVSLVDNDNEADEIVQIGRTRIRRKKEAPLPKGQGRPLSDLLFRSALYASQGRMLPNFLIDNPVRLKNQPDKDLLRESATIQAERYIFPLTAYMNSNKIASLPEIAKATHQPLAKVIDFYNACTVSGLTANH